MGDWYQGGLACLQTGRAANSRDAQTHKRDQGKVHDSTSVGENDIGVKKQREVDDGMEAG